jgi:hypothetical protein
VAAALVGILPGSIGLLGGATAGGFATAVAAYALGQGLTAAYMTSR